MIIYTDGSYRQSTNTGGVGIVCLYNNKVREFSKRFENCTNNVMELMAIYIALQIVYKVKPSKLEIITDSEYAIGISTKNWIPKKNIVLVKKIRKLLSQLDIPVTFTHIKGHNGNMYNEKADTLATQASL